MSDTLLSLGHGYAARALARRLVPQGWTVLGTTRSLDTHDDLKASGVTPIPWEKDAVTAALSEATHLLISAGPGEDGDPSIRLLGEALAHRAPDLRWVGYLSTTGVYGNHNGAWTDETTPLTQPQDGANCAPRRRRPGPRSQICRCTSSALRESTAPDVGHLPRSEAARRGASSRTGRSSAASMSKTLRRCLRPLSANRTPGAIYNVCDDEPAPPQDVIAYAATLLGLPLPPEVRFEDAELTPMARSFYSDNKRTANDRIKTELGVALHYPDYRSGLKALCDEQS